MALSLSPSDLLERVERDVGRALRRGRNGLKYAAGTNVPRVGRTPKDVIWQQDKAQLWHYRSDTITLGPPVLVVHSLVSRSYVLDLQPDNSVIAFLLDAGFDVFMIDWGVPDELEAANTIETYVDELLPMAVAAAQQRTGAGEVTLVGYCVGGLLALILAARHPEVGVRNLATLATPLDWSEMSSIVALIREGRLEPAELLDDTGNVPPEALHNAFRLMRPTTTAAQYATLWENLWNDDFVTAYQAMGQWAVDHVPLPGATCHQLVESFIRPNAPIESPLYLGGAPVDFAEIRCPVLNLLAERDHIVPLAAAQGLPSLLASDDLTEVRIPAGHAGLVAGRIAKNVTLPTLASWIDERSDPIEEHR